MRKYRLKEVTEIYNLVVLFKAIIGVENVDGGHLWIRNYGKSKGHTYMQIKNAKYLISVKFSFPNGTTESWNTLGMEVA